MLRKNKEAAKRVLTRTIREAEDHARGMSLLRQWSSEK